MVHSRKTIALATALVTSQLYFVARSTAVVTGGGGSSTTDCLAVFDAPVNSPATNPKNVTCEDGIGCDEDGLVNGVCEVSVIVCANSTALPACTLSGVDSIVVEHADDNGDPKF